MSPAVVLTTVNAPYGNKLKAEQLAYYITHHAAAKASVPGHMSSFYGEVKPEFQSEFAHMFGISDEQLVKAAKDFAIYSGESYPLAK